ncbi:MAG: DNA recombination protein RmuC [Bauldia sp.]|nr:DNA recombination protein RmuC [Bauldia sp.]
MHQILLVVGGYPVTVVEAAAAFAAGLVLVLLIALARSRRESREGAERAAELEARVTAVIENQGEMSGRMKAMTEVLSQRQSDLARSVGERLDGLTHKLGSTVTETSRHTDAGLAKLYERLAVIDTAQRNITALSTEVVGLQQILANKQTRGAFGQGRMEAIVKDGLPIGSYEFQATLSNRNRPDCLIKLPNEAPSLVVDAKFPLEAWNAIRAADSPDALRVAQTRFRRDTQHHVTAIAERYFIPGETHDTAFMFVPSEAIFADIHEHFEDVVQNAHRARVVIVSPSLLLLSIQVVQALLKDARMREQAHLIRDEILKLVADVRRLDERVTNLRTHFVQTSKDIEEITTSTRKIGARGERFAAMEFEESTQADSRVPSRQAKPIDLDASRQGDLLDHDPGQPGVVSLRATRS